MSNNNRKSAPSRRVVDLDAVRREAEVYERAAAAGERLLAARRALVESGESVDLPTLPEDLDVAAVMREFALSDPPEDVTKR